MEVVYRYLEGTPLVTIYVFDVGGVRVAVDPGPSSLHQPLDVDIVLCTHLHLDHCGSAGFFKTVYAHERYIAHLQDPTRLYESSKAVLGIFAEKFGKPQPVGEVKAVSDRQRLLDAIEAIHTPGHAPHHVMYYHRDTKTLFVGDGGGVYIPELKAVIPTTPPVFRLDMYLASLEKIRGLGVGELCYPHYTCTTNVELLDIHREQVRSWVEALGEASGVEDGLGRLKKEDENVAKVLEVGGLYLEFYLKLSVVGFLDYIRRVRP
ncbi:MAG: MBL fold metallo-hydrolase [Pyrobaculum sp.]